MFITGLLLLGLLVLTGVLVNMTAFQNYLAHLVASRLSKELHTRVEIKYVELRLFNRMQLEGTIIEDQQKDTLLFAKKMSLRITDWFFLKDKPVLQFVGLEDAYINLKRAKGDSLWNYQFIVDAFSPPSQTTSSRGTLQLEIRKIDLNNLRVSIRDAWVGEDMHIVAKRIYLDTKSLDLKKHVLNINSIELKEPLLYIADYTASRPARSNSSTKPALPPKTPKNKLRWNTDNWQCSVKQITIHEGAFALQHPEDNVVLKYFDPAHIAVYHINAVFKNTRVTKDSILSDIRLKAKERSGFEIKELRSHFKLSPVEMEFANLNLITNHSHIQHYYAMQFDDFSDMSDYVSKVIMKAHFKNTKMATDDIAYFAPSLQSWKKELKIDGTVVGTVDNLGSDHLDLQAGNITKLRGKIKLHGLPNISETFIDFQADQLQTTGNDLLRFMPFLRNDKVDLAKLSTIRFKGNFTGFINDFVAYGSFHTNLGNLQSDLNLKFTRKQPIYSGNLSADNFNIGTLLGTSYLGPATFKTKIKGSSFDFNTLLAKVDANISSVYVNGYTYQNIKANGDFSKKFFNGLLTAKDPNLDLNFSGSINFNAPVPIFNFQAEVFKSDLKLLQLTKDSFNFRGKLDLHFAGSNIDNFIGEARLHDINLFKNTVRIDFDSLTLKATETENGKQITLAGTEMTGYLTGNFNIQQLSDAVVLFLNKYYPSLIKKPPHPVAPQHFRFGIKLGKVDHLLALLTKDVRGLTLATAEGSLNTITDSLTLEAFVPSINYRSYTFNQLHIRSNGTADGIGLESTIGSIASKDSTILQNTLINAHSRLDTTFIRLRLSGDRNSSLTQVKEEDIFSRVITIKDGYKIAIINSSINYNNKKWTVPPGNEITIGKKNVMVYNLNIVHNEERISVYSNTDYPAGKPSFDIRLQNLNIGGLIPPNLITTRLEGIANGNIRVDDPMGSLQVTTDLTANNFRLNNDSIGVVKAKGDFNLETGLAAFDIQSDNPLGGFSISGKVGLTKNNNALEGQLRLNATPLHLLEKYIDPYVNNLSGTATGQLTASGTILKPVVTGALKLDSVGVRVGYTGTYYTFTNETIHFTESAIDPGTIYLFDQYKNRATLTGKLNHDHFDKFYFNFDINTDKFSFLNTTALDNSLYYGEVVAKARINFTGPLNDMRMNINATPQKGTHVYLPITDNKDIGRSEFIKFKTYGKDIKPERQNKEKVNLTMSLNAIMNNQANIDVIIDATTGDVIKANGNGNLSLRLNLDGDMSLYGRYTIEKGSYTFNFQRLFPKVFIIDPGSTLTWSGSPYEAQVHIKAVYNVPGGVSLYDLVATEFESLSSTDKQAARRREKVNVYLQLSGSLLQPNIDFDIRLPDVDKNVANYAVSKLNQIKNDKEKLFNQATALLVFGQFIPDVTTAGSVRYFNASVGEFISSIAASQLNNVFGKLFKNQDLNLDFSYNAYALGDNTGNIVRNNLNLGISRSLFNNRVKVKVGSDIDWGRTANVNITATNTTLAPDVEIEYLLTPDGRLRANAFSRSNYDVYISRNRSRHGIGLTYLRQFNQLRELFEDKKRQRHEDSLRNAALQQEHASAEKNKTDSLQVRIK